MTLSIREETPQDEAAIRQVNERAFGQKQEADIVDRLRERCPDRLSLVALQGGRIVGHILFSPVAVEGRGNTAHGMALAPMSVLPEYQRQGIGAALINAAIERLQAKRTPFILVLGHPEYYPKFGFEPASRYGIRSEWDVPEAAFMILTLRKPEAGGLSGVARFRGEFSEAGES